MRRLRPAELACLALSGAVACTPSPRAPAPSPSAAHASPPPPTESLKRPAGYSLQRAVVRLRSPGSVPRERLTPDFAHMSPTLQTRRATAWSTTSVGSDTSDRVASSASLRFPSPPNKSARQVKLILELPEAEQHLTTTLLGKRFEDRSDAPFLGFARALLPSVLIDVAPDAQLGAGATWSIERHYEDAGGAFYSRREYELLQWLDPSDLEIRQDDPIALLEFTWLDGSESGAEQVTTGRLWHSAAWLYPVGYFRQKIEDARISLETMLRLDNPEWPKLSRLVSPG